MAVAACQITSLKAAQSYRVALDLQSVRGCRSSLTFASLGVKCETVVSFGARLRVSGGHRWRHQSSSIRRFVINAAVEEAVSASQADSAASTESLSMYFKAEGILNENAVSKLTKTLEGAEGVSQVKVHVAEGAATVELVKQTNIQETGVASSLVQLIEQAGFKMQALSLGFDDEGTDDDEYIDYDASSHTEEEATT